MNNIKYYLREMYRNFIAIVSNFSPQLASKIYYETKLKKKLNLDNPQTFNEKLMWLKFNELDNNELITKCADKYRVREYVKECGCEEILNDLISVYDKAEEINFSKLPDKFVLKCNHAAGYNVICKDKSKLNYKKTKRQLRKWLKTDYWKFVAEVQYKNVEKKIVCEKFLDSKDNNAIEDYKIYCFNGKPQLCLICVGRNYGKPKYYFMDKEWKIMKINPSLDTSISYLNLEKPKCIDDMYKYAERLAKPFKFVRVDFFNYNDKPIFSELTFTPAGCVDEDYTEEAHLKLGKMIELNIKKNVLMLGPARNVKGGMTSVVDNYYNYGLDQKVNLKYIETINDKNKFSKLIKTFIGYFKFKENIKKYDIVHIHMASRRSTFRKAIYIRKAKKLGKKVIIHIHGAEYKVFYNNECNDKQKKYIKDTLNLSDKVIVLSEEWKDYFKSIVDEEKIEVIYNSILIPNDFEKNTDTQNILFLGRFGKRKGIYDLVDVVEKICKVYPKVKLFAGGDGEVEQVKKIIKDKHLENNISILGWVTGEEKEKYLRECSYYVLPSYNEGMPMSLIEGMAYKNVVISTKVGGIPKVIDDNVNGFLIEPGDREDLYNKLFRLLKKKNLRKSFSENARKTVEEKFDIEKEIQKLINLYNEV